MSDLPNNISFGTVRGVYGSADIRPPRGLTVTFTASAESILDRSASPPVTIVMLPTVCTVDETTGELLGPDGRPGVQLIATDDPDVEPAGWSYIVTYDRSAGHKRLRAHVIDVPSDSDRWITEITPAYIK